MKARMKEGSIMYILLDERVAKSLDSINDHAACYRVPPASGRPDS